jgi:hypothetical protein
MGGEGGGSIFGESIERGFAKRVSGPVRDHKTGRYDR